MARSTLSVTASAVARQLRGFEMDHRAGPLPWDYEETSIRQVLEKHGWTPLEYDNALVKATSVRWVMFSGIDSRLDEDDSEFDEAHFIRDEYYSGTGELVGDESYIAYLNQH